MSVEYAAQHPDVRVDDEDVMLLTRAIGMSIDGFQFEISEATYRTPGLITVYGEHTDSGRKFDVTLQIVEAGEVFPDDFGFDDDEGGE